MDALLPELRRDMMYSKFLIPFKEFLKSNISLEVPTGPSMGGMGGGSSTGAISLSRWVSRVGIRRKERLAT